MFKIIAVTNRKLCDNLFEQIEHIAKLKNKPDMLILREKDLSAEEYFKMAAEIKRLCESNGIEFAAHYFWQNAAQQHFSAIHLPFNIFISAEFQKMKDQFVKIGVSVHSKEEAVLAEQHGADYLVFGNVFETDCKAGFKGKGIDSLNILCQSVSVPVYAIGGIDFASVNLIKASLADGACMMSAFMKL